MDDIARFCSRCNGPIDADRVRMYREADVPDTDDERLCADCAAESLPATEAVRARPKPPEFDDDQPETEEDASPDQPPEREEARPPEDVLDEILREVKHIARNQEYEEFSIWNILGALVQCAVLFLLFWHLVRGAPDLMWPAIFQLLALTLFVMAKK